MTISTATAILTIMLIVWKNRSYPTTGLNQSTFTSCDEIKKNKNCFLADYINSENEKPIKSQDLTLLYIKWGKSQGFQDTTGKTIQYASIINRSNSLMFNYNYSTIMTISTATAILTIILIVWKNRSYPTTGLNQSTFTSCMAQIKKTKIKRLDDINSENEKPIKSQDLTRLYIKWGKSQGFQDTTGKTPQDVIYSIRKQLIENIVDQVTIFDEEELELSQEEQRYYQYLKSLYYKTVIYRDENKHLDNANLLSNHIQELKLHNYNSLPCKAILKNQ